MSNARIYVGTYAKYNDGSLFGAWLDLDDYTDLDSFYEACQELHHDEEDPELMFQDWEGIPDRFISESSLEAEYFDYMDMVNGSHLDEEVWEAAQDLDIEPEMVEELYHGEYNDDEDFAYDLAEQLGLIDHEAGWPNNCIDWERAARDLMYDYGSSNGHYFRTSY